MSILQASDRHYEYTIIALICELSASQHHQERRFPHLRFVHLAGQLLQVLCCLFNLLITGANISKL